jgi:hypothetical protein
MYIRDSKLKNLFVGCLSKYLEMSDIDIVVSEFIKSSEATFMLEVSDEAVKCSLSDIDITCPDVDAAFLPLLTDDSPTVRERAKECLSVVKSKTNTFRTALIKAHSERLSLRDGDK